MPRPRSLTEDQIARAALAVIDRDGLGGLSMRTVAVELGVGTMSLYRYVSDRDELEARVVELVLGAVELHVPSQSWRKTVTLLAERARRAIGAHPAIVPLLLTRRHTAPSSVRWGEAVLRALGEAGFEGKERAIAFRTILGYLLGAVQLEHFGALSGEGTLALSRLPQKEFPYLSETARFARQISPAQEFKNGLGIVLRGLAASSR